MQAGIVGAGLMGRLLAWRLSLSGWEVTLFDKDSKGGQRSAAYAAAGMLSPVAECETSNCLIFDLGVYSLKQWALWLTAFSEPVFFQQKGTLVIAHPEDIVEKERWLKQVQFNLKELCIQPLSQFGIKKLEPELNFREGYFLPQEAHLDSRALLRALAKILSRKLTVDWLENTLVEKITPHCVFVKDKSYVFDCIFDCRGVGGGDQFNDLRPIRGELIYLHAPDVNLNRPIRLLHPRYRVYIVPRPHQIYLIGSSEIESEDTSPISVRTCLELLSAAYSIHRGFAEARVIETVTALRPALLDNLPRIDWQPGLIAINGLYRHGFLLAPALINKVLEKL